MVDWLMAMISGLQRWAVSSLAVELRAGGTTSASLAFVLGGLHALTPGHGKGALAAYFLGVLIQCRACPQARAQGELAKGISSRRGGRSTLPPALRGCDASR